MSAEHLQQAESSVADFLTVIFNKILELGVLPKLFKTGVITPIHKGGGKRKDVTDNYRGITVSSIAGKVFERILADHQDALLRQSDLQFGFTQGLSPYFASIIKTEAIASRDGNVFVATLDAQTAFDVVDHQQLLVKMHHTGLAGSLWLIKQDSYNGLTSRVKWEENPSEPFDVKQGVRQGGIPSTSDYKTYIDRLLQHLRKSNLGLSIDDVYCGAPTVADDVLLLSSCPIELQVMLHVANNYASAHRYNIHPVKSVVTVFGSKPNREYWKDESPWEIDGQTLQVSDCSTHLGVTRYATDRNPASAHLVDKLSVGRRALYALLGAGLHGLNGLHPKVSYHIYSIYILPRILSGLECVVLGKGDEQALEKFHLSTLKHFQNLPTQTASAAVYALLGALPMEGILDLRRLSIFGAIARCTETAIHRLAQQQSRKDVLPAGSWFQLLRDLLNKYGLTSPEEILCDPPSKPSWKKATTQAVNSYWENRIQLLFTEKSTLDLFSPTDYGIRKLHKLWKSVTFDPRDIRRGCTKARILTGTYPLQTYRAKFNQYDIKPECPMCLSAPEDRAHFLFSCRALGDGREQYLQNIKSILPPEVNAACRENPSLLELVVLNCPDQLEYRGILYKLKSQEVEQMSRYLCYHLHCQRAGKMDYRI